MNFKNTTHFFQIYVGDVKKHFIFASANGNGTLAQLVEQRTENPCVPGSIPGGTTLKPCKLLFTGFLHL